MKKIFDNKVFKLLFGFIKAFFIIVIVLYLIFILIQRFTGNRSVFGYRLFTVATGSMAGVYEINDVIAVKNFDTNKLKVGDDVAYQGSRGGLEGLLITHRIIKIEVTEENGKIFTTKGVNSSTADPSITADQILGKVVGVVPIITLLNHVVKNQLGFFILVFCPLVLIIVLEILQTITDIKVEKNELKKIEKDDVINASENSLNDASVENNNVVNHDKEEIEII